MPRPRPPHLHRQTTRHGRTVWYVRVGHGQRIRLRAEYGTETFWVEYNDAIGGKLAPKSAGPIEGSLGWALGQYRLSSSWLALSVATRRQRENIFYQVLETAAAVPLKRIDKRAIINGRERRTPHAARHFLDAMRGVFQWALENDYVRVDPTEGVKIKTPHGDGFPVWSEDEISKFQSAWKIGTRERLIFDIFLYTGLRRGDVARLGKQHIRDGVITLDTEKTGVRISIPLLPELAYTIANSPTGDLAFVVGTNGRPLAKQAMANVFSDACHAAGITKSGHGLRKLAATRLADVGASVHELQAWFGWTDIKMPSLYTRAADRQRLAKSAADKLRTSIPSPNPKVRE
jgi:integrase